MPKSAPSWRATRDVETPEPGVPAGEAADGIQADDLTPRVREAILRLISEIDRLRGEIVLSRSRIADLERLAYRDPLTPVANRRAFVREIERFNAMTERYDTPSSMIYFDIDGMKAINDDFGHAAGDQVLIAVADALTANVRASDVVGRLGGDEFGVILAQMEEAAATRKGADLARAVASLDIRRGDIKVPISVTFGVFTFTGKTDVAGALDAADRAMYAKKPA